MLDEKPDKSRNEDEHSSTAHRTPLKSGNRSSAAKAAPRLFGSSDAEPAPPALRRSRRPRVELSLTQILGSTGAAVTAAFLGSRLGVAGTLIGAALASVISVVGGAIYTTSIKATRAKVAQAIVAARGLDESTESPPTVLLPVAPVAAAPTDPRVRAVARSSHRPLLRGALVGSLVSAVVFVGAIAVVTGVETVSGSALSGGSAGSLTILGGKSDSGRTTVTKNVPVNSTASTTGSKATVTVSTTVTSTKVTPAGGTSSKTTSSAAPTTQPTKTPGSSTTTAPSTTTASPTSTSAANTSTADAPATSTPSPSGSSPATPASTAPVPVSPTAPPADNAGR
jgi:hypothetical protein